MRLVKMEQVVRGNPDRTYIIWVNPEYVAGVAPVMGYVGRSKIFLGDTFTEIEITTGNREAVSLLMDRQVIDE